MFLGLNVSVARLGTGGFDAHNHQFTVGGGKVETGIYRLYKKILIEDKLVGLSNNNIGIFVEISNVTRSVSDAGSRATIGRFVQYLLR